MSYTKTKEQPPLDKICTSLSHSRYWATLIAMSLTATEKTAVTDFKAIMMNVVTKHASVFPWSRSLIKLYSHQKLQLDEKNQSHTIEMMLYEFILEFLKFCHMSGVGPVHKFLLNQVQIILAGPTPLGGGGGGGAGWPCLHAIPHRQSFTFHLYSDQSPVFQVNIGQYLKSLQHFPRGIAPFQKGVFSIIQTYLCKNYFSGPPLTLGSGLTEASGALKKKAETGLLFADCKKTVKDVKHNGVLVN